MAERTVLNTFNELIESLSQAEGAVSQLIHLSGHPLQFLIMRDALSLAKEGCTKIAPHNILVAPKTVFLKKR